MIDTLIFDLDGTLLNTLEDLMDAVNLSLKKHGMPQRSLDDIRRFAGNGIEKLLERCLPEGASASDFADALTDFKAHYLAHCNDKTKPYPGIPALLSDCAARGYQMAVVSNKFMDATKDLVAQFFGDHVHIAIGANEELKKKPAPDTVYAALDALHSHKSRAVYIGDSEVDIATARNAGIPCIAVAWGFRSHEEQIQAGATIFAKTPEEVLTKLESLRH